VRRRDDAPLDLVEPMTPENHFADDKERPSIAENLRRAVLVALLHGRILHPPIAGPQSKNGTDSVLSSTDHTHDNDGFAPRTFASLTDSMNETAVSRIYAGVHYHSAVDEDSDQGRCVADHVGALPWRK
jgi:hypothetical protein